MNDRQALRPPLCVARWERVPTINYTSHSGYLVNGRGGFANITKPSAETSAERIALLIRSLLVPPAGRLFRRRNT